MFFVFTDYFSIPDLVAVPGKRLSKGMPGKWLITFQRLINLYLACYLCAGLLYYLVGWICHLCNGRVTSENFAAVNRTGNANFHETVPTQRGAQGLSRAPGSDSPPDDPDEPLQQPLTAPDQTVQDTTDGDIAENRTRLEDSAIVPTTSPVSDVALPPSWQQRIWAYLQAGGLLFLLLPFAPSVLLVFLLGYLFPAKRNTSDNVTRQQSAAEEGAAGTLTVDSNPGGQAQDTDSPARSDNKRLSRPGQSGTCAVGLVICWILRWLLTLFGRLLLGLGSLYVCTFYWTRRQATEVFPTKIIVNAFGLLNFSTAVLYYLVFFDGEGTSAPAWSDMFG